MKLTDYDDAMRAHNRGGWSTAATRARIVGALYTPGPVSSQLKAGHKAVVCAIMQRMREAGTSIMTHPVVADRAGINVKTLDKYVARLEELGVICRIWRGKPHFTQCIWYICDPATWDSGAEAAVVVPDELLLDDEQVIGQITHPMLCEHLEAYRAAALRKQRAPMRRDALMALVQELIYLQRDLEHGRIEWMTANDALHALVGSDADLPGQISGNPAAYLTKVLAAMDERHREQRDRAEYELAE